MDEKSWRDELHVIIIFW